MRDLLRNPEENLPKTGETVFVSRQAKSGPQVFALNVASLGTPSLNPMAQIQDITVTPDKEESANDKKE